MSDREMEDWTGEVGDRWLNNIDRFEGMLSLLHARLASKIAPLGDERILDVGCGGGPLAILLAKEGAQVTGLDVAPQLIDLARQRAADLGLENLSFATGDAASTTPPGAPFDRLVSAFGVMFFEDSLAAFSHLHSLLKPGAAMDFAAWGGPDKNPWMGMIMGVVGKYAELPEPDPEAAGPFRFADSEATMAMLRRAGFADVAVEVVEQNQPLGGPGASLDQALDFVMTALDMDKLLADQGVDREPVLADLREVLAPFASDEGVMLPGCALFYSGTT